MLSYSQASLWSIVICVVSISGFSWVNSNLILRMLCARKREPEKKQEQVIIPFPVIVQQVIILFPGAEQEKQEKILAQTAS